MKGTPVYYGLYKEGFVYKDGNLKDSPDYNRFSDIIQKIDQNQRLLHLEWDGNNFFIGVQFHCSSVAILDGRPVRDSRRMYFEQIPYSKNEPPILPQILQQFYQRANKKIKSFYSERYDKIQMRLATSRDFNEFISGYIPNPSPSADNELSKYFGGKILFNERCTVLSSDFIKNIQMITDLFEFLKQDKNKIVFIISELDNPNDTKLVWDFLIKIPAKYLTKNQNVQSYTYNADNQTLSESSFTQAAYKSLSNYIVENRSLNIKMKDSNTPINNFIQAYLSSKDSSKMPMGELCKSKLGISIAKELIIKKLQNNEKIDSDILKLVYTSLTSAEQADFGIILLDYDYDFPELYSGAIKKLMTDRDTNFLSSFIRKDFSEYRSFQTNIASTFQKLPWDNAKLCINAQMILERIFSDFPPNTVGEGGKIFTRLLYQTLSDHVEIDDGFILKYSGKMKFFDITIPKITVKSGAKTTKLRWFIFGWAAFAAGILFSWFYIQVLPYLLQQLNGFVDPTIQIAALISVIVLVVLLFVYRRFKKKSPQKYS